MFVGAFHVTRARQLRLPESPWDTVSARSLHVHFAETTDVDLPSPPIAIVGMSSLFAGSHDVVGASRSSSGSSGMPPFAIRRSRGPDVIASATSSGVGEAGAPDAAYPDVWVLDAAEPWFDALADAGVVSDEERARAGSLSDAAAARRFMARRGALRMVLGRYVGQQPRAIRIATAPGGKPVLVPTESPVRTFAFSTSHSGDLYCIAVGAAASVGVDVERLRPVPRAHSIAARWFGDAEALDDVADEDLGTEFMRLWTAKEALAKRHGAGLRLLRGQEGELDVEAASAEGRLHFFSPGPGYAGAIASTEVIEGVEVIRPGDGLWTR